MANGPSKELWAPQNLSPVHESRSLCFFLLFGTSLRLAVSLFSFVRLREFQSLDYIRFFVLLCFVLFLLMTSSRHLILYFQISMKRLTLLNAINCLSEFRKAYRHFILALEKLLACSRYGYHNVVLYYNFQLLLVRRS